MKDCQLIKNERMSVFGKTQIGARKLDR